MADWTENNLIIHGENATQLMQSLLTDNEEFDFNKIIPMPIDIVGQNANRDWMLENWDAVCNAKETSVYDNEVSFQSKWSNVCMLISTLSKQHPEYKFEYEFVDEEPGSNAGWMIYKNGEIIECKEFDAFSKECFEKYFEMCGDDNEYKFDEKSGTYVGIDDCDNEDDADNDDCDA